MILKIVVAEGQSEGKKEKNYARQEARKADLNLRIHLGSLQVTSNFQLTEPHLRIFKPEFLGRGQSISIF